MLDVVVCADVLSFASKASQMQFHKSSDCIIVGDVDSSVATHGPTYNNKYHTIPPLYRLCDSRHLCVCAFGWVKCYILNLKSLCPYMCVFVPMYVTYKIKVSAMKGNDNERRSIVVRARQQHCRR